MVRSRLTLERLDGRDVPSDSQITPPTGGAAQSSTASQQFTLDIQAGDWFLVAQRGTQDVYVTRNPAGIDWVVFSDPVNQTFAAVLLNSPTTYDPAAGTQVFTPDATKPSLVWDPNTNTYYAAPAGASLPANATGFVQDGINHVFAPLQAVPPPNPGIGAPPPNPNNPPVLPPPDTNVFGPPKPAPVPGGGVVVIVKPGKQTELTIEIGDAVVIVKPQPGITNPKPIVIREGPPGNEVLPPPRVAPPRDPYDPFWWGR